jgi:hypothetical protein
MNWIHLVAFDMKNRMFGPHLAAIESTFISVTGAANPRDRRELGESLLIKGLFEALKPETLESQQTLAAGLSRP